MSWSRAAALLVTVWPEGEPLNPVAKEVVRRGLREILDELAAEAAVTPRDPFPLLRDTEERESDILGDYLRGA